MRVWWWVAFAFALAVTGAAEAWATEFTVPMPGGAKLRSYEEIEKREVLVGRHIVPQGSVLDLDLGQPLLYRWILTDQNKVVPSSMPYFPARVKSLPDGAVPPEGEYFVHIRDLDAAAIVAQLFPEPLPPGAEKLAYPFPWDSFNPTGAWAHAIQESLEKPVNTFLRERPPRDMEDFCPRFGSLGKAEREIFWVSLFNQIARYESAFIPLTASDEGNYDEANKGVISSGLTQISIRSSKAACYQARGCGAVKAQGDLFDPAKNLGCAVGIMSCLAESGGCLSCKKGGKWKGIAAYWSTMRDPYEVKCSICPGGKITIGKKPAIRETLRTALPFCF